MMIDNDDIFNFIDQPFFNDKEGLCVSTITSSVSSFAISSASSGVINLDHSSSYF